jgi:two-component sensor histidine kinase
MDPASSGPCKLASGGSEAHPARVAFRVAAFYAAAGFVWIFFSDQFLAWLGSEPAWLVWASIFKGLGFVVVTAALLFLLICRMVRSLSEATRLHREAEERYRDLAESRRVLLRELDHRVKNNLAALASVVSIEARRARDPADFADRMRGKIMAMKTAHELIATAGWESVELQPLVRALTDLDPVRDPDRAPFRLEGPAVRLSPKQAGAVAIIVQELLTNSHKHGSLAADAGRVELTWRVTTNGKIKGLTVTWTERDGAAPPPNPKRGAGLDIIEGVVQYDLAGEAEFRFEPAGLVCTVRFPLEGAKA